jgi:hypothetical protein
MKKMSLQEILLAEADEAFCSWQNKATRNMEDFAEIIEVTREEWKQNKKK